MEGVSWSRPSGLPSQVHYSAIFRMIRRKSSALQKEHVKTCILVSMLIFIAALVLSACEGIRGDYTGPAISDVSTSGKVLVISDCLATAVTITAKVTDASRITSVLLWYRVGSDRPFTSTSMDALEGLYTASVKGSDLQGDGYGTMEFYVTAEDGEGNAGKSPLDKSIQFLPCVNN